MKKQELTGKSDTKKKSKILQGRSAQRESELGGRKLDDYFQQINAESFPENLLPILTAPEFSQPVNASQKANIINQLQKNYGNANIQQMIQAKLKIGQPNDKYEQEADRVADEVVRMPELQVQQQPVEDKEILKPKESYDQTPKVTSNFESCINVTRGGGQPLPKSTRSFFEPRFGRDFSSVNIHNNPEAAEMARMLKAQAFTIGQDIVFGSGQYERETNAGKKLLAHELTHVIQKNAKNKAQEVGTLVHLSDKQSTPIIRRQGSERESTVPPLARIFPGAILKGEKIIVEKTTVVENISEEEATRRNNMAIWEQIAKGFFYGLPLAYLLNVWIAARFVNAVLGQIGGAVIAWVTSTFTYYYPGDTIRYVLHIQVDRPTGTGSIILEEEVYRRGKLIRTRSHIKELYYDFSNLCSDCALLVARDPMYGKKEEKWIEVLKRAHPTSSVLLEVPERPW